MTRRITREFMRKRNELLSLQRKMERMEAQVERRIKELQKLCPHTSVAETPHDSGTFHTFPPRKICLICGLEEEGWGCGYDKLVTEPIRTVYNRDDFYKLRELKPLAMMFVPN